MTRTPETPATEPGEPVATPSRPQSSDAPAWDRSWDIVDQWGADSFPASDPPANW